MNDVITRYLDCWNEIDPVARRKLIDEVWAAVAVLDEHGKITAVFGFLDKVPA
jgi:hypothetical protein